MSDIFSITGYGKGVAEQDGRKATVELKSVNHRFLDLGLKLPKSLMFAEDGLRKAIQKSISRGHILGTFFGVIMGNVLPTRVVSALSVGLYGMFLAIIIPPARKDRVIAGVVAVGFAASFLVNRLPVFDGVSTGIKTIALTVALAFAAAVLFPTDTDKKSGAHAPDSENAPHSP